MTYEDEAQALEATILTVIRIWHESGRGLNDAQFNDLALRIFSHQLRYNRPYARYCAARGITERSLPESWEEIPAVPAAAYKEAALVTFAPETASLVFETSGTTRGASGKHYMETPALYDAALLATFDRCVLKNRAPFRYLNLLPSPSVKRHSSLVYMMDKIARARGDGKHDWYLAGEALLLEAFITDVEQAITDAQPLFIAGTAFAFVQVCDMLTERGQRLVLPQDSLVMETGGFKGRSRIVPREVLYASVADRFGIGQKRIFAEYGMTELTSQYYDSDGRVKSGPPWLRARTVGIDGKRVPKGIVGALAHVDLANRSSCIAVQTEDLAAEVDGGILLLGREQGAALRGCSLEAESLRAG